MELGRGEIVTDTAATPGPDAIADTEELLH